MLLNFLHFSLVKGQISLRSHSTINADRRGTEEPRGQLPLPLQGCGHQAARPPHGEESTHGWMLQEPWWASQPALPSGPLAPCPRSPPASSLAPNYFHILKPGFCFVYRPLKMWRQHFQEVLGDRIPKLQSLQTMERTQMSQISSEIS